MAGPLTAGAGRDGRSTMTHVNFARRSPAAMAAAVLLLVTVVATMGLTAASDHPVVGRFAITSESGGAVWAFQPGGTLVVTGPGEILSEGTWVPAGGDREFDATVEMTVTGQTLEVMGQVSQDGAAAAVHVLASEPTRPDDWTPWPAVSRLVGERLRMVTEPGSSPVPTPLDCARPEWVEDAVDWDRCDATLLTEP